MSQAVHYWYHLGEQILVAVFFLHMFISFIGVISFVEKQVKDSNYALAVLTSGNLSI